jgi:hypothetical protein
MLSTSEKGRIIECTFKLYEAHLLVIYLALALAKPKVHHPDDLDLWHLKP